MVFLSQTKNSEKKIKKLSKSSTLQYFKIFNAT